MHPIMCLGTLKDSSGKRKSWADRSKVGMTELKRRRGGSQIKSFVPVGSGLLSSYRCKDQSVSDSGFAVVVASSDSDVVVVSSSSLVVVVSALLRIRRL